MSSSIKNLGKRLFKAGFGIFGLEIRRVPTCPLPPIFKDPIEALYCIKQGEEAAVQCDLSFCVIFNGMSYSPDGWHPFVETVREYLRTGQKGYTGSVLEKYYYAWQPQNALEALIGAPSGPKLFLDFPPHFIPAPWLKGSPDERLSGISRIAEHESVTHGNVKLTIADGYGLQGPVSKRKGELEYNRLIKTLESIQYRGYDRTCGDLAIQILKRKNEFRYRVTHGHHRAAAMTALGYRGVVCAPRMLVDYDEADNWPQVLNGIWSKSQAQEYFNHHFEFNSLEWAKNKKLY